MSSTYKDTLAVQFFEDLQHSEARFQAMFKNAAVDMGIMSLDHRILDISHVEFLGQNPGIVTYLENYTQSSSEVPRGRRQTIYWQPLSPSSHFNPTHNHVLPTTSLFWMRGIHPAQHCRAESLNKEHRCEKPLQPQK